MYNESVELCLTISCVLSPLTVSPPCGGVGLVRLCDPESNADGSLTTSRATHAGKVKG
jgi:hypothetical protein